jgi:hypothetical protein
MQSIDTYSIYPVHSTDSIISLADNKFDSSATAALTEFIQYGIVPIYSFVGQATF